MNKLGFLGVFRNSIVTTVVFGGLLQAGFASKPVQPKTIQLKQSDYEIIQDIIAASMMGVYCHASFPAMETVQETQSIVKAIRQGDAAELSSFFNNSIELVLPNNEGTYSKVQAQMILSLFFDKNPPRSFFVKQEGSSPNNTEFVIGTYITTSNKTYRVYYVTKKSGNRDLIQHLEFEYI